ncbi:MULTISPECIES: AAA family ATPase [unclassified Leucobacter]|uniref:AAA family ATPase n=1 Tax=unclassified Leucobacter TaxID=2621730 RepID=UPI00069CB671|nr:AAA family ATPase [Leucobacter sp. Ag1]
MTGTTAERNLIASILARPRLWRMSEGLVNRQDFSDDRLGIIYEQMCQTAAAGGSVGPVEVVERFPEWGIRGIDFAEVISWETPETYAHGVDGYARAVRSDALRRTAADVGQYLIGQSRDAGTAPAEILTKARGLLEGAIDGSATGQLQPKPLGEILAGSDSYDWVIPDLLERQDRLILTGAEGAGKTTFARQICVMAAAGLHPLYRDVDVSTGRRTAQLIPEPARVLVVDAENTEKQWRRATRFTARRAKEEGALDPANEVMVVAGHRIDVTRGSHLGEIHRMIDQYKPDLLYIGPLYKITHGAIQTDDDAAPLLVALDSLRERGVALIMEAHASKGDGTTTRDLRPRGSAALMGWPEFGFGLHPLGEDAPDDVELKRWRGDRDERGWPRRLTRGRDWPWELH